MHIATRFIADAYLFSPLVVILLVAWLLEYLLRRWRNSQRMCPTEQRRRLRAKMRQAYINDYGENADEQLMATLQDTDVDHYHGWLAGKNDEPDADAPQEADRTN